MNTEWLNVFHFLHLHCLLLVWYSFVVVFILAVSEVGAVGMNNPFTYLVLTIDSDVHVAFLCFVSVSYCIQFSDS